MHNDVERSITLQTRSITEPTGAENASPPRGVKLRGSDIDESASLRNWAWLEQEALRPPLTASKAPALVISTPKGFAHVCDLSRQDQGENQDDKSWRVTSSDPSYIWKEELDHANAERTEGSVWRSIRPWCTLASTLCQRNTGTRFF